MIDIHTHILPGFDDGAQDLETALQMARAAVTDGIERIIATPHVISGSFDYSREQILAAAAALNEEIIARHIPVQILPGGEYRLEPDLSARLRTGNILTLNDCGRYLLLELPSILLPPDYERVLCEIQLQGVTPIIAHPERNQVIRKNPGIMKKLTERGILAQLTTGSIYGVFGKEIYKCACRLIEQGSIQLLASDAHAQKGHRGFGLSAASDMINKRYGKEYARALTEDNPACVLSGQELPPLPQPIKPSWLRYLIGR